MKIPQRIYLQIDSECESDNTYLWHEGVTWCQDKINETDVEYVLKQSRQVCQICGKELVDRKDDFKNSVTQNT